MQIITLLKFFLGSGNRFVHRLLVDQFVVWNNLAVEELRKVVGEEERLI